MSAEPAADLADLLEVDDDKVFEAAEVALLDVAFSGAFVCESAEPAG